MFKRLTKPGNFLVSCVLCLGFWQLGQGAYIPAKAWLAQGLMQHAWARTGSDNSRVAPWPWADTWPVARMTALSGEVDLIVLAGDSGRTLAFGPGHVSASALPGAIGNVIIGGHRDTHFRFLKDLQTGDVLAIESNEGSTYQYEVLHTEVVDSRTGFMSLDTDTAILSLVTCYPFDAREAGGPLRYVVTARMLY